MDLVAGGQGIEVLGLVEVPEHGCAVFAAGGAEGAVGGNGHGVDVAGVADVVRLDAARGEFPDLECKTLSARTFTMPVFSTASGFILIVVISALVIGLSHSSKALK